MNTIAVPSGAGAAVGAAQGLLALAGLADWPADLVAALGEPGVGLLTFVETVLPPLPSDAVLPLAGFLAQQGQLSLSWVLVAATSGSLAGSWVLYGLGRWFGLERAIEVLVRLPLIGGDDVEQLSRWFERYGAWTVFFGRLVPGAGALASFPAGVQRMSPLVFTAGTAMGTLSWNAGLVGLGYALPARWEVVDDWANSAGFAVVAALVLSLLLAPLRRRVHPRRSARGLKAAVPSSGAPRSARAPSDPGPSGGRRPQR